MAAPAGGGDAWRISGEDRAKHDAQFYQLKPVNGFVTGDQARGFFMQSGLQLPVLGQIWSLADMNGDGKMDKKEFSIAMHLIKKKLQGYELPKALPASLKADPSPVVGSFGTMPASGVMGIGQMPGGMAMGMPSVGMVTPVSMTMGARTMTPMMSNGVLPTVGPPGYMGAPVAGGFGGPVAMATKAVPNAVPGPVKPGSAGNLAMPHQSKLKYTQLFNANDRNKRGYLTGVEARAILVQSGYPQPILAQIWALSDVDNDGKLNCEEFCIAMHLIDILRTGQTLPPKLPPELLPAGMKARSGSIGSAVAPQAPQPVPGKDTFGDLLGGMGMQPAAPLQPTTNGEAKQEEAEPVQPVTFEDRRKANFDKGQAELERRRQMLQDQMKRENEARLEKERREQEQRERIRQEQEQRRQQELERQLEKQRAIEREREEQRRKMMEQREAARRELERQRQMEWERQRREQLMAEKAREYAQLSTLKSSSSNLDGELESLQGKKTEIGLKITQVRNGVTDFTSNIESMRTTRDMKLQGIDRMQRQLQDLNEKLQKLQEEREQLNIRVQTSAAANPMSETHRTMMHSVELKKTSVQRLKKDLEQIERDTEAKLTDIDKLNSQLTEQNKLLEGTQSNLGNIERQKQQEAALGKKQDEEAERQRRDKEKHEKLRKELEAQRLKEEAEKKKGDENWFDFGGDKQATTSSNDNWAALFNQSTATSQPSKTNDIWGADTSSHKTDSLKKPVTSGAKKRYKAVYQFDARNNDELSLKPGDIVMVPDDQTGAEPGWMGGEKNGQSGWFPQAYVEKDQESDSSHLSATDNQLGLSTSDDSSFMAVPGRIPAASPTPGQGQTAPEGLQAQALYPWKAKKDNHLTFNKGDVINVREQQDMWWSGELNGKMGWFPKSYVKLISGPSANSSKTSTPTSSIDRRSGSARESPALDKKEAVGDEHVAVYAYSSNEPGDLTFNSGETIHVTKQDGDWWTGTIGDRSGIFPANYVKKAEVSQPGGNLPSNLSFISNASDSSFANLESLNSDLFPQSPNSFVADFASQTSDSTSDFNMASPSDSMLSPGFGADLFTSDQKQGTTQVVVSDIPGFTEDPFAGLGAVAGSGPAVPDSSFDSTDFGAGLVKAADTGASTSVARFNEDPFANFGGESSATAFPEGFDPGSKAKGKEVDLAFTSPHKKQDPVDAFGNELNVDTAKMFDNSKPISAASDPFADFGTNSYVFTDSSVQKKLGNGHQIKYEEPQSSNMVESLANFPGPSASGDIPPLSYDLMSDGSQSKSVSSSQVPMLPTSSANNSLNLPVDFSSLDTIGTSLDFGSTQSGATTPSSFPSLHASGTNTPNNVSGKNTPLNQSGRNTPSFPVNQAASPKPHDSPTAKLHADWSSMFEQVWDTDSPASGQKQLDQSNAQHQTVSHMYEDDEEQLYEEVEFRPEEEIYDDAFSNIVASTTTAPSPPSLESLKASQKSATSTLKKPEIATVIAPYTATGPEQLSLSTGQLIQVRKKSASGWWEGELQARGQKRKIGWFPANYVKMLASSNRNTPDTTLGRGVSPSPATGHGGLTPSPAPPIFAAPQPQANKYVDHVIALYPYTAQNDDEMTFQKDAVINVIKKDDPDWWQGELNGQIGMFPSNYVSSTSPGESQSWSSDPQVLAATPAEEGKRQNYIHELINTEESYMEDMSIVIDAFCKPLRDAGAISEEEAQAIFVNWQDLIICNTKLLKGLRVRKKMCGKNQVISVIGDVLCENFPHMTPYVRFCSCQLNAATLIQKMTETRSVFTDTHKKCVQNAKTKGMPLSSFLLKPMQRITKYPLVVEKILKYTPENHPDHQNLTEALSEAEKLCSQVNEGVREKENSDRLEWIQQNVHCDGLPERITFNAVTNCLGPRKLLHTAILYKAKSNKELLAFLFNDFLLLTQPSRPLGNVTPHTLYDSKGQSHFKMYKTPVVLNEVMVKKPADDDPCQFIIHHVDRVYTFKTANQTERDLWVKKLSEASKHYLDTERSKLERVHSSPIKGVGRLLVILMEGHNLVETRDVRRSPGVGRLLVVILEGNDLKASDTNGKSDPYCEVSMGAQEHKTKVINGTLNPKWNASMQFSIRDVEQDVLCISVFDRDLFSPNDFLGRTEVRVKEIMDENKNHGRRPITKRLVLHEVETGEVVVKLDLHLFEAT